MVTVPGGCGEGVVTVPGASLAAPAVAFVSYLWHYLAARLLYDELIRPLAHGQIPAALILTTAAGAVGFGLGRRSRRPA